MWETKSKVSANTRDLWLDLVLVSFDLVWTGLLWSWLCSFSSLHPKDSSQFPKAKPGPDSPCGPSPGPGCYPAAASSMLPVFTLDCLLLDCQNYLILWYPAGSYLVQVCYWSLIHSYRWTWTWFDLDPGVSAFLCKDLYILLLLHSEDVLNAWPQIDAKSVLIQFRGRFF